MCSRRLLSQRPAPESHPAPVCVHPRRRRHRPVRLHKQNGRPNKFDDNRTMRVLRVSSTSPRGRCLFGQMRLIATGLMTESEASTPRRLRQTIRSPHHIVRLQDKHALWWRWPPSQQHHQLTHVSTDHSYAPGPTLESPTFPGFKFSTRNFQPASDGHHHRTRVACMLTDLLQHGGWLLFF